MYLPSFVNNRSMLYTYLLSTHLLIWRWFLLLLKIHTEKGTLSSVYKGLHVTQAVKCFVRATRVGGSLHFERDPTETVIKFQHPGDEFDIFCWFPLSLFSRLMDGWMGGWCCGSCQFGRLYVKQNPCRSVFVRVIKRRSGSHSPARHFNCKESQATLPRHGDGTKR